MRVVYLHQYFVTPEMAGGARSYEMARRLVAAGHEVHMVTSDREATGRSVAWRESREAGILVHWTPVRYDNSMTYRQRVRAFLTFAWRAARKAAELRGDIIFRHEHAAYNRDSRRLRRAALPSTNGLRSAGPVARGTDRDRRH